jgi:hypothetical protein
MHDVAARCSTAHAAIIVVQKGCAQIKEVNAVIFKCPVQKLFIWGTIAQNFKHVIKLLERFFVTEQFEIGQINATLHQVHHTFTTRGQ